MELRKGFKRTEIGIFPEDWEIKTFADFVDRNVKWSITGGPFGSNLKTSDYTDDGIQIIQLQNIGDGIFHNDSKVYTSAEKANELIGCNIYPGEIILSKMGDPVARACFIPNIEKRYLMASDGIRLVVNEKEFSKRFVHDYINSIYFRKRAFEVSNGSTRLRIGLPELKKILIIKPSLKEQIAIATALSDADALISSLEKLIEKKRNIKQGAMQQLLKPKKGWVLKKLGEIADIEKGEQLNRATLSENDLYPVLNGGVAPSGYTNVFNQIENTIIISEGGNSCGFVNFIKTKFWQGGHCYSLKTKLNKALLFQILKYFEKDLMALRVGSGLPNIQRSRLITFEISMPKTEEEQTNLANIFTDMDCEIASLEKKLSKTKMLKQGMMQELLTGKIRLI